MIVKRRCLPLTSVTYEVTPSCQLRDPSSMSHDEKEITEQAYRSAHLDQALPEAAKRQASKNQAYLSFANRRRMHLPLGSGWRM